MTVRLVREEEWELARDVRLRALTDAPTAFESTVAEESELGEAEWRGRLGPNDRQAWFVEEEAGRFVGVVRIVLADADPELAWLFSRWVEPERRRAGIWPSARRRRPRVGRRARRGTRRTRGQRGDGGGSPTLLGVQFRPHG